MAGKPGGGGTVQPAQTTRGASRASTAACPARSPRHGSSIRASIFRIPTSTSTPRAAAASSAERPRRLTRMVMAPTLPAPLPRATTPSAWSVSLRALAVVAVRVLDRRGSGSNAGVIAGVDYVAANGRPGDVANMSLGGGISQALDDAVIRAAATGVRFALAAGNESNSATTIHRRVPTGPTSSPSRRSRLATIGRASRTSATRRSIMPSRVRRSSRRGSAAATTPSAAPRWPRRISPA